jgi:hypothetical protein
MLRFIQWLTLFGVVLGAFSFEQAAGQTAIIPTSQPGKAVLHLSAVLNGQVEPLRGGLHWRIYAAQANADGSRTLLAESNLGQPTFAVPPGDYVVHMAFGLSGQTKRVTLAEEERSERLTLTAAGALKIAGTLADQPIPSSKLSISIFVPQGHNPEGKLVDAKAMAGDVIGLPEGPYHVVSTYLDTTGPGVGKAVNAPTPTNSIVAADIKVQAGKIIDLTMRHRVATLTLKLVNAPGAEALANTSFTVLTPGGDLIRELIGAFPSLVLAEGEYIVIARHDQKTYQSTFEVQSALDRDIEVVAQ